MKATFAVIAFVFVASVKADDKYILKSLKIENIEQAIKNDRLLNAYFKCVMEGVGCTPEGEELKDILPEAIQTGCAKCADDQRNISFKVLSYLKKEKPAMWEKVLSKFDPEGAYRKKYREILIAEGLDI